MINNEAAAWISDSIIILLRIYTGIESMTYIIIVSIERMDHWPWFKGRKLYYNVQILQSEVVLQSKIF